MVLPYFHHNIQLLSWASQNIRNNRFVQWCMKLHDKMYKS